MSNAPKVGETTKDVSLLGRRDAFHVPGILVTSDHSFGPGTKVRFTDETLTKVVPMYKEDFYTCEEDDEGNEVESEIHLDAQAVSDPFCYARKNELFWVFPWPGSVENLVHTFDVKIEATKLTASQLGKIEEAIDEEEGYQSCKGCYS